MHRGAFAEIGVQERMNITWPWHAAALPRWVRVTKSSCLTLWKRAKGQKRSGYPLTPSPPVPMPRYDDYSREELVRLLEARDRRDATRFGLVWETNEVEREKALNGDFVALDLDAALSTAPTAGAEGADAAWRNLIIEGDNFDALRFLRMAYAGRVKCICIDPPYNTGNRDFVYNDRYVDKDDAWQHSRWCEFMHQRLTLAKELLAEDGVIFVFIDDNEVHHLGLLMTQIFGEGNFVANVIWQKVYSPKNSAKHFSTDHDYVLVYALNGDSWRPNLLPRTEDQDKAYKNPDNDPRGLWKPSDLSARNPYSEGTYPITTPSGRQISGPSSGRYWTISKTKFDELDSQKRIWWGKDGNSIPSLKRFLSDVMDGRVPQTIWPYKEVGHTQDGKKELLDILQFSNSAAVFSTPKPVGVIERTIQLSCGPDDTVLDFFAGSGTTGHAVLKANAADGGRRRFILVSSTEATEEEPEKNLCRDVCAERVRRVIAGYGEKPGLGGDFAYLRCRRIPEGDLMEIEHSQVWTALQLMHREGLMAYAPAALHWAQDAEGALCYVPQVKAASTREILKRAKGLAGVIVYTWQPGLMAERLAGAEHIQVETIPQSLALKFGLGRGRA